MDLILLKIYLDEWAHQSALYTDGPKGHRNRSAVFSTGGFNTTLDDWEDDAADARNRALDTIIYHDLTEAEKVSVLMMTKQVPKCFKSNRMDMALILDMALRKIWDALDTKGLL